MLELFLCSIADDPAGLPVSPLRAGQAARARDHPVLGLVRAALGDHPVPDPDLEPDHDHLLLPPLDQGRHLGVPDRDHPAGDERPGGGDLRRDQPTGGGRAAPVPARQHRAGGGGRNGPPQDRRGRGRHGRGQVPARGGGGSHRPGARGAPAGHRRARGPRGGAAPQSRLGRGARRRAGARAGRHRSRAPSTRPWRAARPSCRRSSSSSRPRRRAPRRRCARPRSTSRRPWSWPGPTGSCSSSPCARATWSTRCSDPPASWCRSAGSRPSWPVSGRSSRRCMKVGMIGEVTCIAKPWQIVPVVVTEVQNVIASGQVRPTDTLVDVQQLATSRHHHGHPGAALPGSARRPAPGRQLHRQRLHQQPRGARRTPTSAPCAGSGSTPSTPSAWCTR